jgi:UDP-N-acetylglucosamine 1-carboxyvinyltransferase
MNKFVINNNGPLKGDVEISGAKNSVLALMAASILCKEVVELKNVPNVSDVNHLIEAMKYLGSEIQFNKEKHILTIDNHNINPNICLDCECVKQIRASYYLLGALIGKYHQANVSLPGGCKIGTRPIDLHLKGFRKLGVDLELNNGNIVAKANKLIGNKIHLDFASVGATINILLASVLANGTTTIINIAKEPHVIDVVNFLNSMGAKINEVRENRFVIEGVKELHSTSYTVVSDQIEAGTFLVAGAITKGDITLHNVVPKHLECMTCKLEDMGCKIYAYDDTIRLVAPDILQPTTIITNPYPGFPTDMQPQFAVALGLANGSSWIDETIFENRFLYVNELNRMGANMVVQNNINIINGVSSYQGAIVSSPDLRAGAALVLAGLTASSETIIDDIKYIKRGYECFDKKLSLLGANIKEINN